MNEIEKRLVNNIEMEFQEVQEYIRNEIGCTESISLDCLNVRMVYYILIVSVFSFHYFKEDFNCD